METRVLRVFFALATSVLGAQTIHPHFNLDQTALQQLLQNTEAEVQARIWQNPFRFLMLLDRVLQSDEALYRRIDKEFSLTPTDVPSDLVSLDGLGFQTSRSGMQLRALVLPSLSSMIQAARREGVELVIISAYRSYQTQELLFRSYARRDGVARANQYSARAGHSQHQLGTTLDFGNLSNEFDASPAGLWMKHNAWRFGFSLSYPRGYESQTGYQWESWHWRFIGYEATVLQREYFDDLQFKLINWIHAHYAKLREVHQPNGP